jgi:F420-0:gamma-glutamyl ligase
MEIIPIQTRIFQPPKDDIYALLDEYLPELQEEDVLIVTSKILAIHQGRCIRIEDAPDKNTLIDQETKHRIDYTNNHGNNFCLTLKNKTLISAAGIDKSNGDGYYVLWPENINESAKEIHTYLRDKYNLKKLAIIIVDSHSVPMRFGAVGTAIGWHGIEPLAFHKGKKDIFQNEILAERSNIIEPLAAFGNLFMGECNEMTPFLIFRELPFKYEFCDKSTFQEGVPKTLKEDKYYPLLKVFEDNGT